MLKGKGAEQPRMCAGLQGQPLQAKQLQLVLTALFNDSVN